MKATVNADACTGCELCVQTCPEVFKMADDKAVTQVDTVPAAAEATCKESAESCPTEAIVIE